ncbi:MAG TPA: response regulator transcription factor [Verrucomicrobiae bacterium]|nr:response regulator transcription factor [Verrucomicrobiae bacterium]
MGFLDIPKFQKQITAREIEILALIAEGCSNKEIASRLSITTATARTHLSKIYRKLDVRSRTEAAVKFLRAREEGARDADLISRITNTHLPVPFFKVLSRGREAASRLVD